LQFGHSVAFDYARDNVNRRPTIGWVNELFVRERTKTSRNVTISFSLTFKARPSPERATATRGRGPLVLHNNFAVDKTVVEVGWSRAVRRCFLKYRAATQGFLLKAVTSGIDVG
jgi:hypothetical protein